MDSPQKAKIEAARPAPKAQGRAVWKSRESFWASLAAWSAIFCAVAIAASALGWAYWRGTGTGPFAFFMRRGAVVSQPAAESAEEKAALPRRAIDGLEIAEGQSEGTRLAVMVENMVDARPLAGLSKAALVIEAPVEAGITRFLAVYDSGDEVKRIGPIRSARPYYVDWAKQLSAVLMHVGGSPAALEQLKAADPRSLNQFFWGKYFWRDTSRYAPHNVYSSTELLAKGVEARYGDTAQSKLEPWIYGDDAALEARPQSPPDISVPYSNGGSYDVSWRYDRQANEWTRIQAGKAQFDEDGSPVRAKNIVVQYTDIKVIDEVGRRSVRTSGEGQALIVVDGRAQEGRWRVEGGRTKFFGPSGEESSFRPGLTWIEVVPASLKVTYE